MLLAADRRLGGARGIIFLWDPLYLGRGGLSCSTTATGSVGAGSTKPVAEVMTQREGNLIRVLVGMISHRVAISVFVRGRWYL